MCNMRRGSRGFLLTQEASASGKVAGHCHSGDGKHGETKNRQSGGFDSSPSGTQNGPNSLRSFRRGCARLRNIDLIGGVGFGAGGGGGFARTRFSAAIDTAILRCANSSM
jgi:hypothetical protein